jgi:hypothetical protein
MAAENEVSFCVSSAPNVARNTPRSRCSSAHQLRRSVISTSASASSIASRASELRFSKCKASAFSARRNGRSRIAPPDALLDPPCLAPGRGLARQSRFAEPIRASSKGGALNDKSMRRHRERSLGGSSQGCNGIGGGGSTLIRTP